nr:MAG TPA: hypothetical protein [Caudoviricetes sp.]
MFFCWKKESRYCAAFIDSSPNLAGPRLDHAGLVAIQFRRGPGGSPNAARRIPLIRCERGA